MSSEQKKIRKRGKPSRITATATLTPLEKDDKRIYFHRGRRNGHITTLDELQQMFVQYFEQKKFVYNVKEKSLTFPCPHLLPKRDTWGKILNNAKTGNVEYSDKKCGKMIDPSHLIKHFAKDVRGQFERKVSRLLLLHEPGNSECIATVNCEGIAMTFPGTIKMQCQLCRIQWCAKCKIVEKEHLGKTCLQIKNERESKMNPVDVWKAMNTMKCPKCLVNVEKNEGCDHMSCKCGSHFCWKCGQEYGVTIIYNHINICNGTGPKFGIKKEEKKDDSAEHDLAPQMSTEDLAEALQYTEDLEEALQYGNIVRRRGYEEVQRIGVYYDSDYDD